MTCQEQSHRGCDSKICTALEAGCLSQSSLGCHAHSCQHHKVFGVNLPGGALLPGSGLGRSVIVTLGGRLISNCWPGGDGDVVRLTLSLQTYKGRVQARANSQIGIVNIQVLPSAETQPLSS